jgi:diguanylate cyclase (GGDEF)-like protein
MQLSVPTIQIVILANFAALAVVWLYVVRSYPNLDAAKFWQASMGLSAAGAATSLFRGIATPYLPVVIGNALMIFACCLAWGGVRRFYARPAPWLASALISIVAACLLAAFTFHDDINIRLAVLSIAEIVPLTMAMKDLRSATEPGKSPGADLAYLMLLCVVIAHVVRTISAFLGIGGQISLVDFNWFQAAGFLVLVFSGMMANFGFVLMAIDRLRAEVADLAMIDDLTGIANRRHFLACLSDACVQASNRNEPFSLLAIDLDGFKAINDGYGHSAGDECLRAFTRIARPLLRTCDLFARSGGDEFCVILPATTLNDAALIAHRLLEACRKADIQWNGQLMPITASIGIAEWSDKTANDPQMLITGADQALYIAKKQGRDRLSAYDNFVDRFYQAA